jgi:hypothetical protein
LLEPLKGFSLHVLAVVIPSLVHRHSRVRIAALQALCTLMYARGAEMIRELTGFREANVVPIKAFYGGTSTSISGDHHALDSLMSHPIDYSESVEHLMTLFDHPTRMALPIKQRINASTTLAN